jgi:hypothetical protein
VVVRWARAAIAEVRQSGPAAEADADADPAPKANGEPGPV